MVCLEDENYSFGEKRRPCEEVAINLNTIIQGSFLPYKILKLCKSELEWTKQNGWGSQTSKMF